MSVDPISGRPPGTEGIKPSGDGKGGEEFERFLEETIGKVASLEKEAETAISNLTSGDGDIVEAMVAMQKAEISFQVMLEVRNKLTAAYEEIMRMQL